MADLSAMFTNVGPTAGAMYAGQQAGQEILDAQAQQQLRQAQMNEILQRTSAAEQMAPLELQAKQQKLSSDAFTQKQAEMKAHGEILRNMIPTLENAPPAARHALLEKLSAAQGSPLDDADRAHLYQLNPDQLVKELKDQQNWLNTQNERFQQAQMQAEKSAAAHIDAANIQAKSHLAGINAQVAGQKALEAMRIGAGKYVKKGTAVNDIETAVKTGKMTPDKAATSFYAAAQFADNDEDRAKYTQMAQAYEQLAMNLKNAGAQGKPDVGAMTNLPTQNIPSALGGAPRGTAANPIVLK